MYSEQVLGGLFLGLGIWLGVMTYLLYKDRQGLRELFPKGKDRDIRSKFKEVLEELEEIKGNQELVNKNLRGVYKSGLGHLQKVELLRYNPYGDTGGNMSFSLVLLSGQNDGILLTNLHTRSGTRVYIKEIKGGQSEVKLSKEESEVLKKAINE